MGNKPVALVTGSSKGLGWGIVKHFLQQGYKVVGCSRGPSSLQDERYEHTIVDVGDDHQVVKWIRSIDRAHGRIDVVVNNAGARVVSHSLITSTDIAESIFTTNFLGTFTVCRESAKVMIKRKFGRIINFSSIAVALNSEGTSVYTSSKWAIVGFTKVLAKELGAFGITCNVVEPSLVETDMTADLSKEAIEYLMRNLTIKRYATIDDVCNAISFFSSPTSSYITGQVIRLGFVEPSCF